MPPQSRQRGGRIVVVDTLVDRFAGRHVQRKRRIVGLDRRNVVAQAHQ